MVAVTGPANGSKVTSGTPQLSGTASGTGGVSVRIYQGDYSTGVALTTLSAQVSNGQWSVPSSSLPDGAYTVQASQTSGNATGTSLPVRFTVERTVVPTDTTAPTVTITAPSSGSTVTTPTPDISGTAGTATGDVSTATVRIYTGSAVVGPATQTFDVPVAGSGDWSAAASALGDGTYTAEATQSDQTGNVGTSAPVTFTIDTTPADITAPSVSVTSPANAATVVTSTPGVSGMAGTAAGDSSQVTVTLSPSADVNGDAVRTLVSNVAADGAWTVTPAALADGNWTAMATQTDAAGNVGTSTAVTFTVNTRPADTTAPVVTLTSPTAGSTVTTANFTSGGSAGTAPGDAATVTLEVFSGSSASGTPVQSLTAAVASGSWSSTVIGLAAGTWTLRASQQDAAGNTGRSTAVTFTKVSPPTITSVAPTSVGQGAVEATVRVNGSGFTSTTAVSVSGSGVTWTIASRTATVVTLRVSVAADATTTARNVTVTNADGLTATCTGCLGIVSGPRITSVSPSTVPRGPSTTVTVTGSGFRNGQTDAFISGTGVTIGMVKVLSATSMTVVLKVATTAPVGPRSLTVTDKGTLGSATAVNAVTVS